MTEPTRKLVAHPAVRVTFLLGIRDHSHRRSLMIEIVQRARRAKMAGATIFQAVEGYGVSGKLHYTHLSADDAPVSVVIIDRADRIDAFLAEVSDLVADLVITLDDVQVIEV